MNGAGGSPADFYALLGVTRGATTQEIKRAYRARAKDCHPDLHPGDPGAEERFKALAEAYETLEDPRRRADHDRLHPAGGRAPRPSAPEPRATARPPARAPGMGAAEARAIYDRVRAADRRRAFWDFQLGLALACVGAALIFAPGLRTPLRNLPRRRDPVTALPFALILLGGYFMLIKPADDRGE